MKRGFTLIELIAVILILGIIALIAMPVVTSILNDSKNESFKVSTANVLKAIEDECQVRRINGDEAEKKYVIENGISGETINIKGKLPDAGVISVDDECNITAYLSNGIVHIKKEKDSDDFINISNTSFNNIMTVKENGTVVYFNPNEGTICAETEAHFGNGTNNGCMRWYTFGDEAGNERINLILEHNVIAITGSRDISQLDQYNWLDGLDVRLPSLEDIREMTDNVTGYFSSYKDEDGYSKYAYVYNYTRTWNKSCLEVGCRYTDDKRNYYWLDTLTPSYETSSRIYVIAGDTVADAVRNSGGVGLRPVITISKALLN